MALQGPLGFQPYMGNLRPADADRSRTVDVLAAAFAEGRLDGEEHRRRVERALTATSFHELTTLVGDLPVGPLPIPAQPALAPVGSVPLPPVPLPSNYGPARPYGGPTRTDGCAVASLILAVGSPFLFFLFGLPSIAAVITGHIALARSADRSENSRAMALVGTILGYVGTAVALIILVLEAVS